MQSGILIILLFANFLSASSDDRYCTVGDIFSLNVVVTCACGGGEGYKVDLNIRVWYKEGSSRFRQVKHNALTRPDTGTVYFSRVVNVECKDESLNQMMIIEVYDVDEGESPDELGRTPAFAVPFLSSGSKSFRLVSSSNLHTCDMEEDQSTATCDGVIARVDVGFNRV